MTINITELLKYYLAKQVAISHADVDKLFLVCTPDNLPADIIRQIKEKYGEQTLKDASYTVFARKMDGSAINKKDLSKIARIVDSAFGALANNASKNEFKSLQSDMIFTTCTLIDSTAVDDAAIKDDIASNMSDDTSDISTTDDANTEDDIDIDDDTDNDDDIDDSDTDNGEDDIDDEDDDKDDDEDDDDDVEEDDDDEQ